MDDLGTPVSNAQLFSAHQMGSCRMAVSPRDGVVDEEGQCHEVKGLYIMDASVFPTSLGTCMNSIPLGVDIMICRSTEQQGGRTVWRRPLA